MDERGINRRRFLGYSAASLALSQGVPGTGAAGLEPAPVRIGLVGAGTRGTALARTLLELPNVAVAAVCDPEPRHAARAQGIVEKALGSRPEAVGDWRRLLERDDLDAVVAALPCDLHGEVYAEAIRAGKHLYGEKPLGLSLADCDRVLAAALARPDRVVHVGYQRRSNPRFREAAALVRRGELGSLLSARGLWASSNGPLQGHDGWLGRRARSGDWMVEQAVHVWDVLCWLAGGLPERATGHGRRDVFTAADPLRDVTDHYSVMLSWAGGFHATVTQSWAEPADDAFTGTKLHLVGTAGGLDVTGGVATFRERGRSRAVLAPGSNPDTRLALEAFVRAVRGPEPAAAPISLAEARDATRVGLLVRAAVDAGMSRSVSLAEIDTIG